tara:strand:+ start:670 stop:1206 length:537 start_codon:yes stop_codon:yes gene_type:complete
MDAAASQTLLQRELAMKMTKNQLADLVTEELVRMVENGELDEGFLDRLKARGAGVGTKLKGAGAAMVQKGLGGMATAASKVGGGEAATDMATKMGDAATKTKERAGRTAGRKQVSSLLKSKVKKLDALVDDLLNDMKKMGLLKDPRMTKAANDLIRSAKVVKREMQGSMGDEKLKYTE